MEKIFHWYNHFYCNYEREWILMINIITDSIADIPKELLVKYGIETLPMYVHLNGKMYQDGENINSKALFNWVEVSGKYPTTSAPPPADFIRYFDRKEPVIFIGVSSKLSATIANAQIAARELENSRIDVIDSKSISIVYGQIVLQAAKWRNEGMSYEDLGAKIRKLIDRSRGVFILNTLEYLYHGGRCSAINHAAASLLKIRPFLQVLPDGSLGIMKKVHGSREKAVSELISYFKEVYNRYDLTHVSIGHLDGDGEVLDLERKIRSLGYQKDILITEIGCILASHSGPKPLGIAFSIAEKMV